MQNISFWLRTHIWCVLKISVKISNNVLRNTTNRLNVFQFKRPLFVIKIHFGRTSI